MSRHRLIERFAFKRLQNQRFDSRRSAAAFRFGSDWWLRGAVSGKLKQFWAKNEYPGAESAALTELQKNILALLREKGKMSRSAIRQELGVSKPTLRFNIKLLEEIGKLAEERKGKDHCCSLKEK